LDGNQIQKIANRKRKESILFERNALVDDELKLPKTMN
jgi:hypothetical protein